jgi:PhnB protein
MLQPIPYLMFDGNCEEALRFYEQTLGAKLGAITRFSAMAGPEPMPENIAKRVANAQLTFEGGAMLYGGDCHPAMGKYEGIKGMQLTLNYDSVGRAQEIFAALSRDGEVTMPMAPVMWAEVGGMLSDRFGVRWIINGVLKQV